MQSAVKILPYYTYEDYEQWEGKWELIDGIPYAMSPAPTPKHQIIANTLGALLYFSLKGCKHCKVAQAVDYKITEDTIFQPDVSVICTEAGKKFIDFPPALVAEILSPGTELKDRHTKLPRYQQQGVPYYLMISQNTEETEVYMLVNSEYELQQKDKSFSFCFQFTDDCSATIDFSELWQ
jgi:Uma2 family endonuclease